MEQVSIVIPVYNVEKYLTRCVNSVLSQTYKDFRLVLVDDGSLDKCPNICDEYKLKDSRIVVIHRNNGGLSAARNTGIEWILKNNPTEWITFVDSDDWVHPQYIELLVGAAEHSCENVIVSDFCIIDKYCKDYESLMLDYTSYKTQDFFINNDLHPISACGRLFRTQDFINIRFPEGRLHEDRFTTYKILFKYNNIVFINHKLYYCYNNLDSLTRANWNPQRLDDLVAIEEQIQYFKGSKYQDAYFHLLHDYKDLLIYSLKKTKDSYSYKIIKVRLRNKLRKFWLFSARKIKLTKNEKIELFKYSYPFCFRVYRRLTNS